MASPSAQRREQIALYGVGFFVLASVFLALLVRLPEGAGFGFSLALHGPRLLLGLAAGAGLGVAGAFQTAADDTGRGHPLLFAVATGLALGGARGSHYFDLAAPSSHVLGAFECALFFTVLVLGARRLRGFSRLATGLVLLFALGAGLAAGLEGKGDPTGLRPWVFWLLGDLGWATWTTAIPAAAVILVFAAVLARRVPAGRDLASLSEDERGALLGLASLLFGFCLGAVGIVAFFSLMVAIAARWLLGHASLRAWAGVSAVLGALAMVWADALPRALFGGLAPPLGFGVMALAVPWFLLRNDGRSPRIARAAEVLLGLALGIGVVGVAIVLNVLAGQLG